MTLHALLIDLFGRSPRSFPWLRILAVYFLQRDNRKALIYIRLGQWFRRRGYRFLARRMARGLRRDFGCFVQFDAEIGPGLRLPHPNGIVIGQGVRIGANCTIYQQVTLGGARVGDWKSDRYPDVGDGVVLFAGAKLVGDIRIGDGATVGANAVVLRDVPPGHVATGVPAVSRPPKSAGQEAAHGPTQARTLASADRR